MKIHAVALLALLGLACPRAPAAEPDPQQADARAYVLSVALPSISKWCGPVLGDANGFQAAADAWLQTNQAAVGRGHALLVGDVPPGWASLDEYNASRLDELGASFHGRSATEQAQTCDRFVGLLQQPASDL